MKQNLVVTDTEILAQAEAWINNGKQVAIATVLETWGSAPCPPGSCLIATSDFEFFGSVSGGCIEAEVISEMQNVIVTNTPKILHFGVKAETAWRAGLACGGKISFYIEPISV